MKMLITVIHFQIIMYQKFKYVLIDGKNFFDLLVKNEEEAYEKIIHISDYNDYVTDNLLDFAYFKYN